MNPVRDLSTQTFNRLLVLNRIDAPPQRSTQATRSTSAWWRCACQCGATKDAAGYSLVNGSVQSCGCLGREVRAAVGATLAARRCARV